MKRNVFLSLAAILISLGLGFSSFALAPILTLTDYNQTLPFWGTSWKAGNNSVNGYYPSFYTGFVARSQYPERIHIRLSRGNTTRVSVILDENTLTDYLFDLAKRYEFYGRVIDARSGGKSLINIASEKSASMLPQLESFRKVLESPNYGVLSFVAEAKRGIHSQEEIYARALKTLKELNPGRVFPLRFNLRAEFLRWKAQMKQSLNGQDPAAFFTRQPEQAIVAIDTLLFGRVNYVQKPSSEVMSKLNTAAGLATADSNDNEFVAAALDLFKSVTGTKYDLQVLNSNGQLEKALQCADAQHCTLTYPEFTALYPTGSVEASTTDQFGNRIHTFSTPGLWKFLPRGSAHDVDNIREEAYYMWAPKLDYEAAGNGFHNPGLRFSGLNSDLKTALGIPQNHRTFEAVKRGGVSHGCSRLAVGHIWELRHIFPTENSRMEQVYHFGNRPQDFDVYDIDGDGQLEVMGVEYFISYGVQGTSGLARREGTGLEINKDRKFAFYKDLYGERNVFAVDNEDKYIFTNPTISLPSYMDFKQKTMKARLTLTGSYKLYEQSYEKDKVQFYVPYTTADLESVGNSFLSKRIVRLMGRVRGCAPTADKVRCGETAFDTEAAKILREIGQ